jgi:hypothetical protein
MQDGWRLRQHLHEIALIDPAETGIHGPASLLLRRLLSNLPSDSTTNPTHERSA